MQRQTQKDGFKERHDSASMETHVEGKKALFRMQNEATRPSFETLVSSRVGGSPPLHGARRATEYARLNAVCGLGEATSVGEDGFKFFFWK